MYVSIDRLINLISNIQLNEKTGSAINNVTTAAPATSIPSLKLVGRFFAHETLTKS